MNKPAIDFSLVIGKGCGPRSMEYTWRDCALYALGVGCNKNDLTYIYERNKGGQKVLPTFAMLPYINNINMTPLTSVPYGPNEIVSDYIVSKLGYTPNRLHMAMELHVHKAIDVQGTFVVEDKLNDVYDRGEGNGVVADCQMDIFDRAGNPVATLHSYHYHKAFGGWGGTPFDSRKIAFPDREPDVILTEYMPDNLAVLYRLSGDTYSVHIDPEVAAGYGYKMPFNQGLCTMGYATRMLIQAIIPNQPERVTRVYAQMRSVCFPGQNITLKSWNIDEGKIAFQLFDQEGQVLLGNCMFEYW